MEEDIKKCEEFINLSFLYGKLSFTKTQLYEYQKAMSNLVTRYKQLEEENTQLKTITQEYNSYLQDSNCDTKIIIADSEYFANGFFKENFIPKSKVKEKIEEIEKLKDVPHELDFKVYYRVKDLRNIEIGILQQLLEDFEETGNHIPRID